MKSLLVLALAVPTLLALPVAPVTAMPAADQAEAPPRAGRIGAAGRGSIRFAGSGALHFDLAGQGVFVLRDVAGLLVHVKGRGHRTLTPEGHLVLTDFEGTITVRGQGVRGRFVGGPIRMRARGHGHALLAGHGVFSAGGISGNWSVPATSVQW